jgi:hypothetical protein
LDLVYLGKLLVIPTLAAAYGAKIDRNVANPGSARANRLVALIIHRTVASGTADGLYGLF